MDKNTEERILETLDIFLSDENVRVSVVVNSNAEEDRTIMINSSSFHSKDTDKFDNELLPTIYDHIKEKREIDILTDEEDIRNGRFMASSSNGDSFVVLDLPTESLENIARHAEGYNSKQEENNKEEQMQTSKPKVKVKSQNNALGFANGFSIGMSIGTAIVLILVLLMFVGLIRV